MEADHSSALAVFDEAFSQFARTFDPRDLRPTERGPALELISRAQKSLAAMAAITASLMATEPAGRFGFVRPMQARLVANRCAELWGVTPEAAAKSLALGSRLVAQPTVRSVALAGEMSMQQAALVTEAVEADPEATHYLIETSSCRTLRGLAAECDRIKARQVRDTDNPAVANDPDDQGPVGPDKPRRHLRSWLDRKGGWHMTALGTLEDGQRVMAAVRQFMPGVSRDRLPARHSPGSAGALDGLVALADAVSGVTGPGLDGSGLDGPGLDGPGLGGVSLGGVALEERLFSPAPATEGHATRGRADRQAPVAAPSPKFGIESLDWLFNPSDEGG